MSASAVEPASMEEGYFPLQRSRAWTIACRILDGVLALTVLAALVHVFYSDLIYRYDNILDYTLEAFLILLVLRAGTLVPWRAVAGSGWKGWLFTVATAAAFLFSAQMLVMTHFREAIKGVIVSRTAYIGKTDSEISNDINEYNLWYPRNSFVDRMIAEIPPDAKIAFIGDQRAHVMSYHLYPRKVYCLPRMQELLNIAIQDNWTWASIEDPFFPPKKPESGIGLFPQDEPNREIQEQFWAMVKEKQIEWVVCYDSVHPQRSWYRWIDPRP